ncbi:NUDIX domain-containing protein [Aquimarina muelleri]|uniref:GDP-mannose pyrophosphatase n=1 Tax=Aquimarina muelleri TaxID=279356 RepID=A0A918JRK8_9FLAO|nr:NUDIX hydrolase [Aquimarina muelleri]MCX2763023.1 NUDIX hydrolase [Aquimarina muelleri]GGX03384.1 ADP-ribose pyrophosphatase [Aquimarina muelleri]
MKYNVLNEKLVYNGFLKIKKATIIHDSFYKETSITCSREMLDRGDSVAVLLHEKDTNQLIFINQFRYPTIKKGTGWLKEIPAGELEFDEDPVECAIREVKEETGYKVNCLDHVSTFYATPGGSSERMYLYFGEVVEKDKEFIGGGVQEENEDILLCKFDASKIDTLLKSGIINDAKSIIALQWFIINKLK